MDATRQRDGKHIMLKKVYPEEGPYELTIIRLFSSPEFARNRRNHCVPLLDTIETRHGQKLMAMPLLRPFDNPRFQTFGEFVAFFSQICEVRSFQHSSSQINSDGALNQGLQFMHERNVAHRCAWAPTHGICFLNGDLFRDCTVDNIMFDPSGMYPQGFHPTKINRSRNFKGRAKRFTRTQRPPRYYLIDFGLSRQYHSREALDMPLRGGDKSAPEHRKANQWCNPFYTDIYYLGNLVREEFMKVKLAMIMPTPSIITLTDHVTRNTTVSNSCKISLRR